MWGEGGDWRVRVRVRVRDFSQIVVAVLVLLHLLVHADLPSGFLPVLFGSRYSPGLADWRVRVRVRVEYATSVRSWSPRRREVEPRRHGVAFASVTRPHPKRFHAVRNPSSLNFVVNFVDSPPLLRPSSTKFAIEFATKGGGAAVSGLHIGRYSRGQTPEGASAVILVAAVGCFISQECGCRRRRSTGLPGRE